MCSCMPGKGPSNKKCKRFLIGNLEDKPPEEQEFYRLVYPSLTTLRLGKVCGQRDDEGSVYKTGDDQLFTAAAEGNTQEQQTYIQWRAAVEMDLIARLTRRRRTTIYLQPIGSIPEAILDFSLQLGTIKTPLLQILKAFAEIFFYGKQVVVLPAVHIATQGWAIMERTSKLTGDPQLLVRDFFPYLKKVLPSDGVCIMGLSWLDLYPCDRLNFVLGESSTAHKAGVFSFGHFERHREENTAHPASDIVDGAMLWQLLKTFTHEVCHLLRLEHCPFFRCSMNESHTVVEAMDQPLFLCPVCLRKVQKACRFNLLQRYSSMSYFLTQLQQQCPYVKFAESIDWLTKCVHFLENGNAK